VREEEMFDADPYDIYFGVGWMKRTAEWLAVFYSQKLKDPLPVTVVRPSNIFGPRDKFSPDTSHVTAALIRRLAGHLDYTIATHYDGDHVSGLSPIVRGPDGAPGRKGVDDNANGTTDEDAEIGATP
jgi:nucleoside-diphosphate-sugar epimerase